MPEKENRKIADECPLETQFPETDRILYQQRFVFGREVFMWSVKFECYFEKQTHHGTLLKAILADTYQSMKCQVISKRFDNYGLKNQIRKIKGCIGIAF